MGNSFIKKFMGNSESEAKAELNTIYSLSDEKQTEKIIEIIQNYFEEAKDITEGDILFLNKLINNIDNQISHGNATGKNQYKTFYEYIALSLIQFKELNKILNTLVELDGVCFKTIVELIISHFGMEIDYKTNSNYIKPYNRELRTFIIENFDTRGKICILYILFKLGLMFYKQQIEAAQAAEARYLQYVE